MFSLPSPLRHAEHQALSQIALSGEILDLGGDSRSDYRSVFKGTYRLTTVNVDPAAHPDIVHNLEYVLTVESASYEGVLIINVLEHIFEYRQLLTEAVRVLKPGGTLVVVVPFLFPIHPSPRDFWRFTSDALRRELEKLPVHNIAVTPLGGGVLSARYSMLERLLPYPFRFLCYFTCRYVIAGLDAILAPLASLLGKRYSPEDYPLGYSVVARKN